MKVQTKHESEDTIVQQAWTCIAISIEVFQT